MRVGYAAKSVGSDRAFGVLCCLQLVPIMSNESSPISGSIGSLNDEAGSPSDSLPNANNVNQHDIFGSDSESGSSEASHKHSEMPVTSEDEESANHPAASNAPVSARDILGSSDSEDDEDANNSASEHKRSASVASSGESMLGTSCKREDSNDSPRAEDNDQEQANEEQGAEEEDPSEIGIAADFAPIRADLGKEIFLVKMPNFLSVETRPFDPAYYEGELDDDEILDEEGRTRLKLKVENTIRWRSVKNEQGEEVRESNARIVRWSDGSLSLHLGEEIFDVHKMDIQSDYNHLYIREDRGLQGQAVFRNKLSFRPHSIDSFTHRKMTLSLADKSSKSQKVKVLPVVGANPESNRWLSVRKEEEKLRVALRRESQQRRLQLRQAAAAAARSGTGRSSSGSRFGHGAVSSDEDDDIGPDNSVSLSAIKRNAKAGYLASTSSYANKGPYSSDSDDASVSEILETRHRKKAKISDEDESD